MSLEILYKTCTLCNEKKTLDFFHTAKGYRGLNPEGRFTNGAYGSSLVDGYQRGSFPIPKTFIFGIDVNF